MPPTSPGGSRSTLPAATRRSVLQAAAIPALVATPAIAATPSDADTELHALGVRFEQLADLRRATAAQVQARMTHARVQFEAEHPDFRSLDSATLIATLAAYERAAGVCAPYATLDQIDREMDTAQARAAQLPATTLHGLRTKVLIAAYWYVESADTPELTSLLRDLRRWCLVDA